MSCKKRWAFHNLNSADCRGSGISSTGVFLITQVHLANVRVQRRIARCPKQRAIMRVHISRITTKTFQIREQSAAIDSVAVQRLEHLDATIALDDQLSKVRLYVRVKFQRHELARFLREAVGCEPSVLSRNSRISTTRATAPPAPSLPEIWLAASSSCTAQSQSSSPGSSVSFSDTLT